MRGERFVRVGRPHDPRKTANFLRTSKSEEGGYRRTNKKEKEKKKGGGMSAIEIRPSEEKLSFQL